MGRTIYLDIAKRTGYTIMNENGDIWTGYVDFEKYKKETEYISSTKRKSLPKDNLENRGKWVKQGEYYHLIKTKSKIVKRTRREILEKFFDWMEDYMGEDYNVVIEAPVAPKNKSNFKTQRLLFGFYGILDLLTEYREIQPNEWFDFMIDKYPHLQVWNEGKKKKNIDTKKTSIKIASYLMEETIKDDNEADSINMYFYDVWEGEKK